MESLYDRSDEKKDFVSLPKYKQQRILFEINYDGEMFNTS